MLFDNVYHGFGFLVYLTMIYIQKHTNSLQGEWMRFKPCIVLKFTFLNVNGIDNLSPRDMVLYCSIYLGNRSWHESTVIHTHIIFYMKFFKKYIHILAHDSEHVKWCVHAFRGKPQCILRRESMRIPHQNKLFQATLKLRPINSIFLFAFILWLQADLGE
jgi:hypothetical protein